jgi:hypothetical protein
MPSAQPTTALRLLAEDPEDLQVISAALQDAIVRVGDIAYEPRERTVTLALNRFCWERGEAQSGAQRIRSALQFGSVLSVKARRIKRDPGDAVVELLAVDFAPGEAPGGQVLLSFAGDADLRLEVECLDAVLADLSQAWPAVRAPRHE